MIYFLRFFYFPSFVVRSVFSGRYFMATLSYYVGITSPGDTVRVYHSQTHNQSAFFVSLFEHASYSSPDDSFDFDSGISNSVRSVNILTHLSDRCSNRGRDS